METKNKGITLIALIITIIVLLILAGVTIATLTGNHGILTQVDEAKVSTIKSKVEEEIGLAVQSANLKIRTKTATDNSWNATTDANIIIIRDILKEDLKDGYTVTPEELNTETGIRKISVVYAGSDYKKATKKDNAKITKTLDVSQNKIIYGDCDHSWEDGEVIEATCTEAGSKKQTCTKCGETQTVTIEAGHSYGSDNKCIRCGVAFSGNLTELGITWEILADIAKQVSQDPDIDPETTEVADDIVTSVTKTVGDKTYTISLGDWMPVEYGDSTSKIEKKARIIGFKHDELADGTVYGGTADTYAGISFEFVNTLEKDRMNSTDTNEGGWEGCELRAKLLPTTGEYYAKLPSELTAKIKTVKKKWNRGGQDVASLGGETQDKLWLLSYTEVKGGHLGTNCVPEGVRYGNYTNGASRIKYSGDSSSMGYCFWWLRSPSEPSGQTYCFYFTDPEGVVANWRSELFRVRRNPLYGSTRLFNLASLCKPSLNNNKALKN